MTKLVLLIGIVIAVVVLYQRKQKAAYKPPGPPGGANPNLQTWGRLW